MHHFQHRFQHHFSPPVLRCIYYIFIVFHIFPQVSYIKQIATSSPTGKAPHSTVVGQKDELAIEKTVTTKPIIVDARGTHDEKAETTARRQEKNDQKGKY